jgi:hypothetical protein
MVLDNIKLCLSEDRPSANITSPGPIPVNLEVSELVVSRGLDGVFHIEPPGDLTIKYICSYHVRFDILMMASMKIILLLDVVHVVWWIVTMILEELAVSIFKVEEEVFWALKVEAADPFKTLVIIYQSTQCHIPENSNPHKSYLPQCVEGNGCDEFYGMLKTKFEYVFNLNPA